MNDPLLVSPDVDYTQALPIQQKRIIAFINHFIMNTVSFLNLFAQSCETKLMEFEFKLRKVDASLKILESQLASISPDTFSTKPEESQSIAELDKTDSTLPELEEKITKEEISEELSKPEVPEPSEDPRYSKYFKMLQFGVPLPAVKLKMSSEGLDPNILDTHKN